MRDEQLPQREAGSPTLTLDAMAARVLHEGIPNSELLVIPDAGHMSFVEQTAPYVAATRRFLSGVAVQA